MDLDAGVHNLPWLQSLSDRMVSGKWDRLFQKLERFAHL